MLIFAIGARVFWKRPDDESAQLFFAVCIVTVGAFMGGYHWTEIVTEPGLIYPFALFAVFVPVVNLHFFLVFPRPNPVLVRHKRRVLVTLYGVTDRLLDRTLGEHVRGSMVFSASGRLADNHRFLGSAPSGGGVHRAGGLSVRNLHLLRDLQLPQCADPRRAQPGALDHVGYAHRDGLDRLPACAGVHRPRHARAWQCRVADVRRVAALHRGVRVQHHALQADAGRRNHQSQRGLFRLQPHRRVDLFRRAAGERQVHRRPAFLESVDNPWRGCGGALGHRGADPL